jgi:prophage regulatory protein
MRILDPAALKAKGIRYSAVHLARLEKNSEFPKRIKVGLNRIGWIESEIDQWIEQRVAERDAPDAAASERPRGWQCQENPEPPRRRKAEQAPKAAPITNTSATE